MKLSLLCLAILLLSCKKEDTSEKTFYDVAYGNDPAQKMDIYLPPDRSKQSTKVIVLVHGGAWNQGDKTDFTIYLDSLKKRLPGYAIFNINYRLANGTSNFFPAQEDDVKSAVEFIYAKRNEYLVSETFVMLGASAGAHLALLHSYKYPSPVKVKAVVDFFGPTELVSLYNGTNPLLPVLLASVTGGTPTTLPSLYQQSSPYNFVAAGSPPTIILHGGADPLVPPNQSTMLRDKLVMNAVPVQFVYYPSEAHGWLGSNLTDSFNKIVAFLNEHVIL
jgi:acetyl esterase/lipase